MKELIFRLSKGELVSGQKFETNDEIEEIIIIDMHGNIVKSIKNKPISYYQNVDIANLPTGYYNLKALLVNGKTENAKFIKE